jgi:hypothetical protein
MLTHYGCETAVGCLLQPSMALLILELGMGSQPFTVDFLKCGAWVMESWVKNLWEKVFIFGITLEEGRLKICPPREWDEWIMLNKRYEKMCIDGEKWSRFSFPLQSPPKKDFRLWRHALLQLRYACSSPTLGRFLEEGHKKWDWRYSEEENRQFQIHAGGMDIYTPSEVPRYVLLKT